MFILTVASVIISMQNVEGSYDYQRPGMQLSNKKRGSVVHGPARGVFNEYKNYKQGDIILQQHRNGENSYFSNSFNTIKPAYLNAILNNYQDFTGFVPIATKSNINTDLTRFQSSDSQRFLRLNTVYGPPKIGQSQTLIHHHQVPIVRYLENGKSPEIYKKNVQKTVHRFLPNLVNANRNLASDLNLQNEFKSANVNNPSLNNVNNLAKPIGIQNTLSPVITKHVYFHAPPPDTEEISVKPKVGLPKKSYKIIFIKVPNQEYKNIKELQTYDKMESIENKTLIYLLSDNSEESSQNLAPVYKPSEHEVLFVKYNGNHSIGSDGNLIEQDNSIQ